MNRFLCIAGVAVLLTPACGGDEEPSDPSPQIVLETNILSNAEIDAVGVEAETLGGGRDSSRSPAELAGIGVFPSEATPGVDIYTASQGEITALEFDIDSDGVAESLSVFLADAGVTYFGWETQGRCRLAFKLNSKGWYFDVPCGEDGGLVCVYEPGATCQLCDAELCAPCTFDDEENPNFVSCEEIIPPEPDPEPDVVVEPDIPEPDVPETDVGEDVGEDGGPDVIVEPDTEPDVIVEPDAEPDVGPTGDCDPSCMASPDAVCCTSCGCGPSDCLPVCSGNYTWDCEVQCCFDYDLLQCDGA